MTGTFFLRLIPLLAFAGAIPLRAGDPAPAATADQAKARLADDRTRLQLTPAQGEQLAPIWRENFS